MLNAPSDSRSAASPSASTSADFGRAVGDADLPAAQAADRRILPVGAEHGIDPTQFGHHLGPGGGGLLVVGVSAA